MTEKTVHYDRNKGKEAWIVICGDDIVDCYYYEDITDPDRFFNWTTEEPNLTLETFANEDKRLEFKELEQYFQYKVIYDNDSYRAFQLLAQGNVTVNPKCAKKFKENFSKLSKDIDTEDCRVRALALATKELYRRDPLEWYKYL